MYIGKNNLLSKCPKIAKSMYKTVDYYATLEIAAWDISDEDWTAQTTQYSSQM